MLDLKRERERGTLPLSRLTDRFRRGAAERVEMVPTSPWWGEHRSRYHFAAKLAMGRAVLDVACGTGYGLRILTDAGTEWALGVDLSWDALQQAQTGEHVFLCRADGTRLPLRSNSMDGITSFETLEHIEDDVGFVAELRRVLKSDGFLVLSTPNALHSRPVAGVPRNPFHVHEYEPEELIQLLSKSFGVVELFGQRVHPRYPVCPFWERQGWRPPGVRARLKSTVWKIEHRLPFGVKDRMSRLLHNRAFYPGEYDFEFMPEAVLRGHVLVAVCRP